METWKNHVRVGLQQRDHKEKFPFVGVFMSLSQLQERFEIRKQILEDQSKSFDRGTVEKNTRLLQLQLRESEHLEEKLSQTVSDLTAVLYLKEAELQYWQSRASQYRQEALTLAKGSNTLKMTLSEFQFTIETLSKELSAVHEDNKRLQEALTQVWTKKERLVQQWLEEKREEAERLNEYNDTQERWQHLAKQLKKHLHREMGKRVSSKVTSSMSATTETSQSVIQRINNTRDAHSAHSCVFAKEQT